MFPNTTLGQQLLKVTKVLQVGAGKGLTNPVFSCTLGGFDTHRNQIPKQVDLFQTLGQAMYAFYEATQEIGMSSSVTTFTCTEFSRTLIPNNQLGTEHGWGGHQTIMGGRVLGGDVYGQFPSLEINGNGDAGGGILIPTTASAQYHATIASWCGCALPPGPFQNMHLGFIA